MIHNDESRVSQALLSGVVLGAADRGIAALWRGAAHSRSAAVATQVSARWRGLPAGDRRAALGWFLIAAAVASLLLAAFYGKPPGWLWLIPPSAAVSVGLLLMLQSRSARA